MNNYKESEARKMNEYSLDLTALGVFSGYYETFWDSRYTATIDMLCDELTEHFGEKADVDYKLDYYQIEYEVGTAFAGYFESVMNELGGGVKVFYDDTYSPNFYNFDTDHIFLLVDTKLSSEEFNKLVSQAVEQFHSEFDSAGDGSGVWFTEYVNYEEIISNNITEITVNGRPVEIVDDRWEFADEQKASEQLALI